MIDTAIVQRLDAAIDAALTEQRIVGAVVIVKRHGASYYARAAGLADRETPRPMALDTVFRLASLSKPITSVAAMRLVDLGTFALTDPVTKFLPSFRPALADGTQPDITLAQLLTHTAGLTYRFREPADSASGRSNASDGMDQPELSLDENLARLAAGGLVFPPGSAWRYSMSIDVMGAVIAAATGAPLPEAIAALITQPLGLTDTGFQPPADLGRLAVPYLDSQPVPSRMTADTQLTLDSGGTLRFDPTRLFSPRAYPSGGAGMVGTAPDFSRFLDLLRQKGAPLLRPDTMAAMCLNQVRRKAQLEMPGMGFGIGWSVLASPSMAGTPQSPGTLAWTGAYGHSWFVDPLAGWSVVALTNTALEGTSGKFATDVRDALYLPDA